jgi:Tfp pilus assembly protein PilX
MKMNLKNAQKGMIIAVILFILFLAIGLLAIVGLFWSKTPITATRLQRFQAINNAEAGLYETFNRFRSPYWSSFSGWNNPAGWASGTSLPANNKIRLGDGTDVEINLDWHGGRIRVSATVNLEDISL